MYEQIIKDLRQSYDRTAEERDGYGISAWKIEERDRFLALLHKEDKKSLLEIGAGPGWYGKFFQDNGLTVVCTDLSPEMVRLCREKGLAAHVMDFMRLDFPEAEEIPKASMRRTITSPSVFFRSTPTTRCAKSSKSFSRTKG